MTLLAPLALALLAAPSTEDGNVRVVDALTGAPIPGAQVFGVPERMAPVWGAFWFHVSATADDEGWLDLPLPTDEASYGWLVTRADGYAPDGRMELPRGGDAVVVEMHPVVPAEVRLVDYLGRPQPLVHLGFCVGCGHTPDVASAVTDHDGRATLMAVGHAGDSIKDVYPVGETVLTDYLDVRWESAIDGGFETIATPGATLEGVLVLPDGSSAAGHAVGFPNRHRGPWTTVDGDGRFRLHGVPPDHQSYLTVKNPAGESYAYVDGSRVGVTRIIRLDGDGEEQRAPDAVQLEVTVGVEGLAGPFEENAVARIPFEIWDPATGWSTMLELIPGETEEIMLAPGSYEAEVGGRDTPYERRHLGRVEYEEDDVPYTIETVLPSIRVVRLEVLDVGEIEKVETLSWTGVWSRFQFDEVLLAEDGSTRIGIVESFPVPSEAFGMWLYVYEKERDYVLLDLERGDEVFRARR